METRFGSKYREVRETEGSRNRDSTVFLRLKTAVNYGTVKRQAVKRQDSRFPR